MYFAYLNKLYIYMYVYLYILYYDKYQLQLSICTNVYLIKQNVTRKQFMYR